MKTFLKIVVAVGLLAMAVQAQQLPNSTPEESYQSVMSKASGESYVRQEPIEPPSECHTPDPSDYYDPYLYYYGSDEGATGASQADLDEQAYIRTLLPLERKKYLRERAKKRKALSQQSQRIGDPTPATIESRVRQSGIGGESPR